MQILTQVVMLLAVFVIDVQLASPTAHDFASFAAQAGGAYRRPYNPSPTYFFSPFFGKELKGNFFFAYQYCASLGMHLASPHSPENMFKLIDFMREEELDNVWTSANDLSKEGTFLWMVNSKPVEFADWHPKQPDNEGGAENCVEVKNVEGSYRLNDKSCSEKYTVVCQQHLFT